MILSYRLEKQMAVLLETAEKGILCHPNIKLEIRKVVFGHFQICKAKSFLGKSGMLPSP